MASTSASRRELVCAGINRIVSPETSNVTFGRGCNGGISYEGSNNPTSNEGGLCGRTRGGSRKQPYVIRSKYRPVERKDGRKCTSFGSGSLGGGLGGKLHNCCGNDATRGCARLFSGEPGGPSSGQGAWFNDTVSTQYPYKSFDSDLRTSQAMSAYAIDQVWENARSTITLPHPSPETPTARPGDQPRHGTSPTHFGREPQPHVEDAMLRSQISTSGVKASSGATGTPKNSQTGIQEWPSMSELILLLQELLGRTAPCLGFSGDNRGRFNGNENSDALRRLLLGLLEVTAPKAHGPNVLGIDSVSDSVRLLEVQSATRIDKSRELETSVQCERRMTS